MQHGGPLRFGVVSVVHIWPASVGGESRRGLGAVVASVLAAAATLRELVATFHTELDLRAVTKLQPHTNMLLDSGTQLYTLYHTHTEAYL